MRCNGTCEFIGAETLKARRELLGGYGDKKAIEVVRILVEEPTRRRLSISELVELGDDQRGGTRDIHRDRAVVVGFECTHNEGRVIDDRGLEAGSAPRRGRECGGMRAPRRPRAPARASGTMRSTGMLRGLSHAPG